LEDIGHVELAGVSHGFPSATTLVELAHPLALREEFVQPSELNPLYLRKADVRIGWVQRDEPVAGLPHD
jgi:tRNA threonylcarbamoyladenosine biosynthesis protein TsaB